MDEFLAVIKQFAGPYCPENYMDCDGRSLQVNQYQALYAVIGTCYGGDGRNTFNLPDFRPYTSVTHKLEVPTVNVNGNVGTVASQSVVTVNSGPRRPWRQDEPRFIICVNGYFPSRQ